VIKSLCAPDDYSTSSGAQRLFDHRVFVNHAVTWYSWEPGLD